MPSSFFDTVATPDRPLGVAALPLPVLTRMTAPVCKSSSSSTAMPLLLL